MQIRLATATDVSNVVDLVNSAYRGESSRRGWTTEAHLLAGQRTDSEMISEMVGSSMLLLAFENPASTRPFACVQLVAPKADLNRPTYLGLLTVDPTLQGKGIGDRLLSAAESYASQKLFAREIEMTVIGQRSELIAWYERRGYRSTGEKRPFPMNDKRFGDPLRNDLFFVVLKKTLDPVPNPNVQI